MTITPAPGVVLDVRPLPRELWPEGTAEAHAVSYTGRRHDGDLVELTGTVYRPTAPPHPDGRRTVSYAHGTTGMGDCGAPSKVGLSAPERAHVAGWLRAGYVVAAADYEGLGTDDEHPFLNGRAVADDLPDIVRAARGFVPDLSTRWLTVGFSQGAHAALFLAEFADRYAPELDHLGTVALAPPCHVADVLREDTTDPDAAVSPLIPMILAGMSVTDGTFDPRDILPDAGDELIDQIFKADLFGSLRAGIMLTNRTAGLTGIAGHPEVAARSAPLEVPVSAYPKPLLLCQGTADPITRHFRAERLSAQLTEAGASVDFRSYADTDHAGVLLAAQTDAITWAGTLTP